MSPPLRSQKAAGCKGRAAAPGDKSLSHRALILSSQTLGTARITGLLEGEDVLRTATALRSLGVVIRKNGGAWEVEGVGVGGLAESRDVLDLGNAGTGARLLMGLVAPYPFSTVFTGDESLRARPMGRVIEPLKAMGAAIAAHSGNCLPLVLTGAAEALPITYSLPVPSAQVKSAILLAGLNTRGKTTVIEPVPTRDHTENMMRHLGFGIEIATIDGARHISVTGQQAQIYTDRDIHIPGDPSSSAFPVVAALLCPGSEILIENVCVNPLRTGLFATLREMGAQIMFKNERTTCGEPVADIAVKAGALKGVAVPPERAPSMIDEYPILAVAASFASGETAMHGLAELRVKESDRLAAIVRMLSACGVKARADGDSLYVMGSGKAPAGGARISTGLDHRIAMSALIMGMATENPVEIDDADPIKTSFPDFVELMNGLGARIIPLPSGEGGEHREPGEGKSGRDSPHPSAFGVHPLPKGEGLSPLIIAVDGPAASGKGTLARRLAEHFGLDYLDTGSLYRAVGMKLVYAEKDPHDKQAALEAARNIDTDDLANPRLRQERIGQAASIVSAFPKVRQALLEFQREFAMGKLYSPSPLMGEGWGGGDPGNLPPSLPLPHKGGGTFKGAVLDGRDIGTVVCPDADFKFFITATLYARARRRHKELSGQGYEVVFDSVLEDLRERDERDEKRAVAPLKPAADAIVIDTSEMDINTVFKKAREIVDRKLTD